MDVKVSKTAFDSALAKMIKAGPLPASEIGKGAGPKRKPKKATR